MNNFLFYRYLKANRNIKKGDLIFSEKFLLAGPQRSSDVVCTGCQSEFQEGQRRYIHIYCKSAVFIKEVILKIRGKRFLDF